MKIMLDFFLFWRTFRELNQTDMDLLCSGKDACLGGDWFQREGNAGEAVVSAVCTPEPGTLALASVGLIGLLARKRKAHRTPIAAQTRT